jgi:hypothetical protein
VSKSSIDPDGYRDEWTYDHNHNGRRIRELELQRVTGLGTVQTLGVRLFRYDAFGRLTGVYADFMESKTPIAEYHYNRLGQRMTRRYEANANVTVAVAERYHFMYHDRWRRSF